MIFILDRYLLFVTDHSDSIELSIFINEEHLSYHFPDDYRIVN